MRFDEDRLSFCQQRVVSAFLAFDPVAGTNLGLPGAHNGRLPTSDPRERARLLDELSTAAMGLGEGKQEITNEEGLDAAAAIAGVRGLTLLEGAQAPLERSPAWYVSTALEGLYGVLLRSDLALDDRAAALAERLAAIPSHLVNAERNLVAPLTVLRATALGDVRGAIDFCRGDFAGELNRLDLRRFEPRIDLRLSEAVAALERYHGFLGRDTSNDQDDFALGRETFDRLLAEFHVLPFTADKLGEIGRNLVAELDQELRRSCQDAFGHPRWREALDGLESTASAAEGLLDKYQTLLGRSREFVADRQLSSHGCVFFSCGAHVYFVAKNPSRVADAELIQHIMLAAGLRKRLLNFIRLGRNRL